jgi:hypothetical protein
MEAAGTAPTKETGTQLERMDVVDCGLLGIHSMAEFEALLAEHSHDSTQVHR